MSIAPRCPGNLREDLESQQDLVAQFHLFAPGDLRGLLLQWDLLLPSRVQKTCQFKKNINVVWFKVYCLFGVLHLTL